MRSYDLMKQVEDILVDEEIFYDLEGRMFLIPIDSQDHMVHAIIPQDDAIIHLTRFMDDRGGIDVDELNRFNTNLIIGHYESMGDVLAFKSSYMVTSLVSRRVLLNHIRLGAEAIRHSRETEGLIPPSEKKAIERTTDEDLPNESQEYVPSGKPPDMAMYM